MKRENAKSAIEALDRLEAVAPCVGDLVAPVRLRLQEELSRPRLNRWQSLLGMPSYFIALIRLQLHLGSVWHVFYDSSKPREEARAEWIQQALGTPMAKDVERSEKRWAELMEPWS